MNTFKAAAAGLSLAIALSLTACGKSNNTAPSPTTTGSPAGSPSGTTPAAAGEAEAVYKSNCMGCHGADLSGGVGPNLQKVGGKLSTAEVSARISDGGGGMPAFKGTLTDDQINALAAWLGGMK